MKGKGSLPCSQEPASGLYHYRHGQGGSLQLRVGWEANNFSQWKEIWHVRKWQL